MSPDDARVVAERIVPPEDRYEEALTGRLEYRTADPDPL